MFDTYNSRVSVISISSVNELRQALAPHQIQIQLVGTVVQPPVFNLEAGMVWSHWALLYLKNLASTHHRCPPKLVGRAISTRGGNSMALLHFTNSRHPH